MTLRMLASDTSGYPDWIQGNEPSRRPSSQTCSASAACRELLRWAFALRMACAPGTCFDYAHTNYAVLTQVISEVTGQSVRQLIPDGC